MSNQSRDRELGMECPITRRDFLNGVSVAVGTTILAGSAPWLQGQAGDAEISPEKDAKYYPPALMGMRGNHEGSYQSAHSLRDGEFWDKAGKAGAASEHFDLVVAGGGISGLAAAYFYRQHYGPQARILILDNHDDFGGHAKRNEFGVGNRTLLSYGGTQSIESPGEYSKVAKELLVALGVDVQRFYKAYDRKLYAKLGTGCFFDRETFGEDRLVTGMGSLPWQEFLSKAPLSDKVRTEIARVYTEKVDYFPGLPRKEKLARLGKISYADYLTGICHLTPEALPFFQCYPHDLFGVGIDAVSALDCFNNSDDYGSFSYAGFSGLDLDEPAKEEPYIFHFPDGNASIARLLVRTLAPGTIPGHTMEDVVTARADYSQLDRDGAPIRIRLNSTVVQARHAGPAKSASHVDVTYIQGGKLHTVRGRDCVLACYNMIIPYLCPEMPAKQKQALHGGVKVPLVYTHVGLRNWTAFQKLGIRHIVAPGSYHTYTALDFPVSIGEYEFPSQPDEPMVLFMLRTPCAPGMPRRDQHRAGRAELLDIPFSTFERNIREQLGKMLGTAGFDPARDIEGITVNRWAHGYAYEFDRLTDPYLPEAERPHVIGRQRFGRISIANSDAGASAYTNVAIDQAYRAVREIVAHG